MSSAPIAVAGPFHGVRTLVNAPYEDASRYLYQANNGYFVNSNDVFSWMARPGFSQVVSLGTGARMQGTISYVDPTTGSIYNFFAFNGRLYRGSTDVTPVGITIDASTSTRVSFVAVGGAIVVTDGVNRPWVMSNFGGTPATGTYIDIDGAGGAWSTWGKPTLYQDSVMFITRTVPGGSLVIPRVGLVWCEPNQPTVGYTQTGYADFWNIIENGSEPLYAILGTNNGLFYWRESSIGLASGTPSINFSTTATRDYRGDPVGTICPWAVAIFNDNIFFLDNHGHPWMMPVQGDPQPIWQQAPGVDVVSNIITAHPDIMSWLAVGAIAPELNQYVVAVNTTNVTSPPAPTSPSAAMVFDAQTGVYSGAWYISGYFTGMDVVDTYLDANGLRHLLVCGGIATPGASGGYAFSLNTLSSGLWNDPSGGIDLFARTHRLGYSASRVLYPDAATFITTTSDAYAVTVVESGDTATVTPITSVAGTLGGQYRGTMGLSGTALRSMVVSLTKTVFASAQWGFHRIEIFGQTSPAGANDL